MAYFNLYANFFVFCQKTAAAVALVWAFTPTRFYFLFLGIVQAVSWWGAAFIYRHLAGDILVLHYTADFGIDLIGPPLRIFIFPILSLAVFLLNLLILLPLTRQRDFPVFAHLLLAGALNFAVFINLALFFLYLINFR